MKIRSGFVSNSSSSSFIIAGKKDLEEFIVSVKINLGEYIIKNCSSREVLKAYLLAEYGYSDFDELIKEESWVAKIWEKGFDAIDRGKTVHFGSFNNDDGGVGAFLCDNGIPEEGLEEQGVEIIENEGGY